MTVYFEWIKNGIKCKAQRGTSFSVCLATLLAQESISWKFGLKIFSGYWDIKNSYQK